MRNEINSKTAEEMVKKLLTTMRNCKKLIDNENKMFDKNNFNFTNMEQGKILNDIQKFDQLYRNVIEIKNLREIVPEAMLKVAATEHDLLLESISQYDINLQVLARIGRIFMDSIKENVASTARNDMGYNKNGKLVSSKTVLSAMPSITFNNKV